MPELSYRQDELVLRMGGTATVQQVMDLQRDLRKLGYLRAGIDGVFGLGTARAIKALQNDLLTNNGSSRSGDDSAPVRLIDFNRGVTSITGEADQSLVESISAILDDSRVPTLPSSTNPVEDNRKILAELQQRPPGNVPTPFLLAIDRKSTRLNSSHLGISYA